MPRNMTMLDDISFYYCSKCVLSQPRLDLYTKRFCFRYNIPVKDTDFCSQNTKTLKTCECCGEQFADQPTLLAKTDEENKFSYDATLCPNCAQALGQCGTCKQKDICSFETDPSPLPKVVQKQIRQGNMTAVTQIMNPERIRLTCEKDCPCYSPDFSCQKQNRGTCQQYHMCRV